MTEPRPMRILFVYDAVFPDQRGGVEHRNLQLAEALAARGHSVTIAGWFGSMPAHGLGVEYVRLRYRSGLYGADGQRRPLAALRLALACLRLDVREYDVVETANIPYAHVWPLALKTRLRGVPLLVTWHEYWGGYWREYAGRRWPVFAVAEWITAQAGTGAAAVSELTHGRVSRHRKRGGVILAPNGIPLAAIRAAGDGAPPGPPLVYLGRLLREKRIDLLLEATALLRQPGTGPLLTIIGEGPDAVRLRRLTATLGIEDRVAFSGALGPAEAWRAVAGSSLAVQPSSREGFGLFPLEAMALGVPVVYCASTESALPELVRDGIEGRSAAPDAAALAEAIQSLLDDPAERARLAERARARAEAFDWDIIAVHFEATARSLAERRGRWWRRR